MFRIGEFSKIAQVSGRLLRYYDEIDLFKPGHIDSATGYRYYTARQLPRLNRILAFKGLGLSLEQVGRLLDDEVTVDEIRGMLTMRKAQIEQNLREEVVKLNEVERRLHQIESEGRMSSFDIVLKQVEAQPYLSIRETAANSDHFYALFAEINQLLPPRASSNKYANWLFVMHSDIYYEDRMDLEFGLLLNDEAHRPVSLSNNRAMTVRELPAAPLMATVVHRGFSDGGIGYNAIGTWLDAQGFNIVGPGRELMLEWRGMDRPSEAVIEIQFPVEKR